MQNEAWNLVAEKLAPLLKVDIGQRQKIKSELARRMVNEFPQSFSQDRIPELEIKDEIAIIENVEQSHK